MESGRPSGSPPLSPGAGRSGASAAFLGSLYAPRRGFPWGLNLDIEVDDFVDFDELLRCIYDSDDVDDADECFEELMEHLDNQRW